MNKMNKGYSRFVPWLMALLLSALAAGCGGGGGGGAILGGGDTGGLAPQVTVVAPLPNATGVPVNTKIITAAFTKAMDPATLTSATFTLACPAGTSLTGTVSYVAAGNVATLTLPGATTLPASTVCTATVTTAAKDTTGISMASNFAWTFTTGAAADTTPPTVTGTLILNGATGVPVNTKVGATFSEAMDPTTISTTTFTLTQGATAVSGTVTYTGVSAVFSPASTLAANTTYTATITTGSKDLAGNALASNFVWSWTTGAAPDTTAPTVTGTVPLNGATNVAINIKVGATFSEAMDASSINTVNFTLKETVSGTAVAGVVTYSGVNALFVPVSSLANSRGYTVTVKGGANGAKDLAGNPLASDFVVSWTTSAAPDTTAPIVVQTINADGATDVAINTKVGATFSEAMDPLSMTNVNFALKETVSGAAVAGTLSYSGVNALFIPLSNLTSSTGYTVTIKGGADGVKDLAGNAMVNDFVNSWTTGVALDTTAPTVISTIPRADSRGASVNATVTATFSEPMDLLTITTSTMSLTCGGTAITGTVGYASNVAAFIPASALPYSSQCGATVTTGVKDLAGIAMASTFTWNFITAEPPSGPPQTHLGPEPLVLGEAGNYAVFARTKIEHPGAPAAAITGDMGIGGGLEDSTAITGFALVVDPGGAFSKSPQVTGNVYARNYAVPTPAKVQLAYDNMVTAYDDAAGRLLPDSTDFNGSELGGQTFLPGLHKFTGAVTLAQNTTVTLTGGPNDVWIFQIATSLTTGANTNVSLLGGARPENVFWQLGETLITGDTSHVEGIFLTGTSVTLGNLSSVIGRLLAQAAVTVPRITVVQP